MNCILKLKCNNDVIFELQHHFIYSYVLELSKGKALTRQQNFTLTSSAVLEAHCSFNTSPSVLYSAVTTNNRGEVQKWCCLCHHVLFHTDHSKGKILTMETRNVILHSN